MQTSSTTDAALSTLSSSSSSNSYSSLSSSTSSSSVVAFTHPCSICGSRIPLSSLVQHLDTCREERVYALAKSLQLPDTIANLFVAGTHNLRSNVAALIPPLVVVEKVIITNNNPSPTVNETHSSSIIPPTAIQEQMQLPGLHSSLILPPPEYPAATDWYTKAKNQQYSTSSIVQGSPFDSVTENSSSNHAIILLPHGPSYLCNDYDAGKVCSIPIMVSPSLSSERGSTVTIYIGSEAAARSPRFLEENNIKGIINCAIDSEPLSEDVRNRIPIYTYTQLPIVDAPGKTNTDSLIDGAEQVHRSMVTLEKQLTTIYNTNLTPTEQNNTLSSSSTVPPGVLIHCVAGVSRSTSVLIAYLVKYQTMTLLDAATLVKKVRKVAYPNIGFWKALRDIEFLQYGNHSIPEEALQLHKSCPLTALRIK